MKLYIVHDDECTYAIKPTIEEARDAAREVWIDIAGPYDEWSCEIGELDTDMFAPQSWPTVETVEFAPEWEDDEDD